MTLHRVHQPDGPQSSPSVQPLAGARPAVVYLPLPTTPPHEHQVHSALARRLAELLGYDWGGVHDAQRHAGRRLYAVPAATLDDPAQVAALGIRSEDDLFGGVVPQPFLATKAISHDLVGPEAVAPPGWSPAFARRVAPVVLTGFTAFSRADAWRAGLLLLRDGAVRFKPACARGGRGQSVVDGEAALREAIDQLDDAEWREGGAVLEENLTDVVTYSVGQLRLPALLASYSGTQYLTPDNQGREVYGGSALNVVGGDFESLMAQGLDDDAHRAVAHAWRYDQAVDECLAGVLASRRNYDVVIGRNARGECRCGVLEQSWRIGGASGAEVAALEVLAQGGAHAVSARVLERYGAKVAVPEDASVLYQDDDPQVGPVCKYVQVRERYGECDGDAK
ncbi:MAG: DUF3182 family protein [Comamonas sp.]